MRLTIKHEGGRVIEVDVPPGKVQFGEGGPEVGPENLWWLMERDRLLRLIESHKENWKALSDCSVAALESLMKERDDALAQLAELKAGGKNENAE